MGLGEGCDSGLIMFLMIITLQDVVIVKQKSYICISNALNPEAAIKAPSIPVATTVNAGLIYVFFIVYLSFLKLLIHVPLSLISPRISFRHGYTDPFQALRCAVRSGYNKHRLPHSPHSQCRGCHWYRRSLSRLSWRHPHC